MDIEEKDVGYIAGTPFVGAEVRMKAAQAMPTAASSPFGT